MSRLAAALTVLIASPALAQANAPAGAGTAPSQPYAAPSQPPPQGYAPAPQPGYAPAPQPGYAPAPQPTAQQPTAQQPTAQQPTAPQPTVQQQPPRYPEAQPVVPPAASGTGSQQVVVNPPQQPAPPPPATTVVNPPATPPPMSTRGVYQQPLVVESEAGRPTLEIVAMDAAYGAAAGALVGVGIALLENGNWWRDITIGTGAGILVGAVVGGVQASRGSSRVATDGLGSPARDRLAADAPRPAMVSWAGRF